MKHLFFITLLLLLCVKGFSQNENSSLYFIHFNNYTVEMDKVVKEALKGEKVTYTCIPSGIVAIEVSSTDPGGKERIANLLSKKIPNPSFEFVSITQEAAESSCATLRVPH